MTLLALQATTAAKTAAPEGHIRPQTQLWPQRGADSAAALGNQHHGG